MLNNILPVVALAGAAYAACPLSVEIAGAENHVAQVAVTNTGTEAVTVFKGNTVFSEHATKDLLVTAAGTLFPFPSFSHHTNKYPTDGTALPFEGTYVNYKRTGLDASMFQVIQPGETITASVNAAKTYKLAGVESAQISAIQGFKYVVGEVAPSTLKETTTCSDVTSSKMKIIPDQSTAAEYVPLPSSSKISS